MSNASILIDRTSLSKPALVISDDSATYRLTEAGVGYVVKSLKVVTAADSPDVHGSETVAFAYADSALPVECHIIGATWADVQTALDELEEALFRIEYDVTRTVKGVAHTYKAGPTAPQPSRSVVDSGVVNACFDTFTLTIPVYPIPEAP